MNKLYAGAAIITVLTAAAYGLTQYGRSLERADHNEKVAQLQDALAELGLVIHEQESLAADETRKAVDANREKIHAIQNNDHQTAEVKRLEQVIRQVRADAKKQQLKGAAGPGPLNYRIIITDAVNRVWEEGRDCIGLPESERASVLQKHLHEVTGDDITELFKYAQGEYCGCGVRYNKLLASYERTVDECNKKRELN